MPLLSRCSLALLVALATGARAQEAETTFRTDSQLVVLHASVIDKSGKLVTSLPRTAFKVFENSIEQPIKTFRREDVPVSLGLVIDNSGSMRNKRKRVEAAAIAAIKASNTHDEVTVVNFNDEAYQDVEFTGDIKKMEEGLTKIDSRGGTAMRDAVNGTIDYVKKKGKHDKKVLFVVTDGNDTASAQVTLEKLVQKAHDSEVLLYFIGLLNEEDKREAKKAKRAMEALAQASGGTAVFPEALEDVESVALSMAQEIRNQYIITYTPTNQALDGTFRAIKVLATGPGKPTVRTRSGYFAVAKPVSKNSSSFAP